MKAVLIPLNNGGFVTVDEEDAAFVLSCSWYSVKSRGTQYAKTGKNGRLHRLLLNVKDKSKIVDHINGNGLDNRRANLRIVSLSENVANRQKSRCGNKCPGVYLDRGKWIARLTINYKQHHIGVFEKEEDAILAINALRIQIGRPPVVFNNESHI